MADPGILQRTSDICRDGDFYLKIQVKTISSRCDFQRTVQPEVMAKETEIVSKARLFPRLPEYEWALGLSLDAWGRGLTVIIAHYWSTYLTRGVTLSTRLVIGRWRWWRHESGLSKIKTFKVKRYWAAGTRPGFSAVDTHPGPRVSIQPASCPYHWNITRLL